MGITFGSVIGGLILAPFTAGTSLGVAVAIGSGAGTAVGVSSAAYNMVNNRDAPEDKKLSSFLIGAAGGALAPAGGLAYGMGAEVTVGVGVAGIGSTGITNAGDGKIKPYIGDQEKVVKYYTKKEEEKNKIAKPTIKLDDKHPTLLPSDFKLLELKRKFAPTNKVKSNETISSINVLQYELASKAFLWVSYDIKKHADLEKVKTSVVTIIDALGHIAKEYRTARIGGAPRTVSVATALDSKIDIVEIVAQLKSAFSICQENKRIHDDLIELSNKHFPLIITELRANKQINKLPPFKIKSDLKDYEIYGQFLKNLKDGVF
jgi:hypothetical protein